MLNILLFLLINKRRAKRSIGLLRWHAKQLLYDFCYDFWGMKAGYLAVSILLMVASMFLFFFSIS